MSLHAGLFVLLSGYCQLVSPYVIVCCIETGYVNWFSELVMHMWALPPAVCEAAIDHCAWLYVWAWLCVCSLTFAPSYATALYQAWSQPDSGVTPDNTVITVSCTALC